jgi:formylglycine-generating enzyme required for sulfatase activity
MYGFVIALLLCNGASCDLIQPQPTISYPDPGACAAALPAQEVALRDRMTKATADGHTARLVCLHAIEQIVEVEEPHDVLDTAIVHKEPSGLSPFVGLVEKGRRTLVTGVVTGTNWVRVMLADGKSGFVYADRLRKVGEPARTAAINPPSSAPAPAPPAPSVPTPAPAAAAPPPTPAQVAPPSPAPVTPPAVREAANPAAPPSVPIPPPAPPTQPAPVAAPPPHVAQAPPSPPVSAAPPAASGVFQDCPYCPVMVPVPSGRFLMGSNEDWSERPPHQVTLQRFALARHEITLAEWNACVEDHGCTYRPPGEANAQKRPVGNLSWDDAEAYVRWLQKVTHKPYRLPSEAEWEYAAEANATSRFSWGDQPAAGKADCNGCGGPHDERRPDDIDTFPPNAWGFYGMSGGVAEWMEDCWHLSYQGAPADGTAWRTANCRRHVLRGGSWMNPPSDVAPRVRNFYDANVRYIGNGARVALTMP